ncbi:ABC transporter ATP-binding protein [Longirhabdus pacifica]|uniref:ABC transporter ATP-binding protein n=1 Tax=Longirhabdus pacifica TaxID=2305227 RepID=UPI001008D4F3|nr:ABC transporter ATP-binding protein [Longirhabdus pacifica]
MLEVQKLTKTIHNKSVFEDISFSIEPGQIIGLVGRNGAGKTTLLKSMVGIFNPQSGDVKFEGVSVYDNPSIKKHIVFVPDSPEALKSYTVKEIVKLYNDIYPQFDERYFYELLQRFSLSTNVKIGNYSKGMKALFALVLAFSTKAKLIILDEPTDGLDVIVKKKIIQYIVEEVAEKQTSILVSSHRLDEIEFIADKVLMMKQGKLDSQTELMDMKSHYKKVQVVFKKELPPSLQNANGIDVLNQTGRVYTLLLSGKLEKANEMIQSEQPLLFEELPMTLEDVFVSKLGGDGDVA